jgi:hypothetical protein
MPLLRAANGEDAGALPFIIVDTFFSFFDRDEGDGKTLTYVGLEHQQSCHEHIGNIDESSFYCLPYTIHNSRSSLMQAKSSWSVQFCSSSSVSLTHLCQQYNMLAAQGASSS